MNDTHINDHEIQRFAFDKASCSAATSDHVQSCATCSERVELYLLLSKKLKENTIPSLDPDLSASIMLQLSARKKAKNSDAFVINAMLFACVGFSILALLLFGNSWEYLWNSQMIDLRNFFFVVVILISLLLFIEIYMSYDKKVKRINSSIF